MEGSSVALLKRHLVTTTRKTHDQSSPTNFRPKRPVTSSKTRPTSPSRLRHPHPPHLHHPHLYPQSASA